MAKYKVDIWSPQGNDFWTAEVRTKEHNFLVTGNIYGKEESEVQHKALRAIEKYEREAREAPTVEYSYEIDSEKAGVSG